MDYTTWGTRELIERIYQLEAQVKKEDKTYNGWANYETWRVNLEVLDGYDWGTEVEQGFSYGDILGLSDYIKQLVEQVVLGDEVEGTLCRDYADAFLDEVNYYEIAKHIAEQYPGIIK